MGSEAFWVGWIGGAATAMLTNATYQLWRVGRALKAKPPADEYGYVCRREHMRQGMP